MAEEIVRGPEPTDTPQPQTKSQVLKYLLWGLLGLLLLAGTTYAGYWWGTRSGKPQLEIENLTPTQPPSVTPTFTPDPTVDWETYRGKKYEFKYPPDLYPFEKTEEQIILYGNKQEAERTENCLKEKWGTLEAETCGHFVLNIGGTSYRLSEYKSLEDLVTNERIILLKPEEYQDLQGRKWKIGEPVQVPGAINFQAYITDAYWLYELGIQADMGGFLQYKGSSVFSSSIEREFIESSKLILSTFKFLD